jgi:hypothetical protein
MEQEAVVAEFNIILEFTRTEWARTWYNSQFSLNLFWDVTVTNCEKLEAVRSKPTHFVTVSWNMDVFLNVVKML